MDGMGCTTVTASLPALPACACSGAAHRPKEEEEEEEEGEKS